MFISFLSSIAALAPNLISVIQSLREFDSRIKLSIRIVNEFKKVKEDLLKISNNTFTNLKDTGELYLNIYG